MKILDREVKCISRSDVWNIYPLGDLHIGSKNCAEKKIRAHVKRIQQDKRGLWFGGGDILDAIKPQDAKRFDIQTLPDWLLEGDAEETRDKLSDIIDQQFCRAVEILKPIAPRCLGLIEGNHERTIRRLYNENIHKGLCNRLKTVDLTAYCWLRLRFKMRGLARVIHIVACHGFGGGRSEGAEPNHLGRMLKKWAHADILFRGHSHTYHVMPPKPVLYVPANGKIPDELKLKYIYAANWGCWLYSHAAGASTYDEVADYPARPMMTEFAAIQPFYHTTENGKDKPYPKIEIRSVEI